MSRGVENNFRLVFATETDGVVDLPAVRRPPVSDLIRMRIRQLLAQHGRDDQELARRLGLSKGAFSSMLHGRRGIDPDYLGPAAAFFGLSLQEFWTFNADELIRDWGHASDRRSSRRKRGLP